MKKTYKRPVVSVNQILGENLFAASMGSNIGIGNGGNASDDDIFEADGNKNMWDMW